MFLINTGERAGVGPCTRVCMYVGTRENDPWGGNGWKTKKKGGRRGNKISSDYISNIVVCAAYDVYDRILDVRILATKSAAVWHFDKSDG